ncbi:Ac68-like protein [Oryctes rhinoceros nudivirus]|uniref:Ac68-like protein n=1 Tax=Oryctes rhinoceros nudivirus TaxID=92521 RepID=A0A6B9QSL1_9VIRU|nr:Ac68-like protein [Oryctes rhinoceros nudivirus]ACH96202.1 Ac68-like protein [Oryctes rhinoceros nudivirus]QHG11307.1 Ac68-like protein [Oryctes rhinoceros nudivirus]QKE59540.1 Ac68-like protein [Oryctes rhinoceros nudivirus]UBO76487.1 Ac68-like protein [Oryctes rhinoceros nudivirus]UBR58251.1 PIF-6 protein [Oryctes rhinoceros nudivirus]
MKLTIEEFKRIRPVQWSLRNFGKHVYNTTINQTETQLFWLDFMRLVFAPKFKTQYGVPKITNFDITQPVLMTDDLDLKLPTNIETAMYFANNTTVPVRFSINVNQLLVAIVAIVIIVALIVSEHFISKRIQFEQII